MRQSILFSWILILTACGSLYAQIPEFATSFEEREYTYNNNRIHATFTVEIPGANNALTYTLQEMGITDDQVNIMFFSEVNDTFNFYVDGHLQLSETVNTIVSKDGDLTEFILYPIKFPEGKDTAILTVSSLLYGGFQTEIKRSYPMLYLKRYKNEWYLDHNTVVKIPFQFFLYD